MWGCAGGCGCRGAACGGAVGGVAARLRCAAGGGGAAEQERGTAAEGAAWVCACCRAKCLGSAARAGAAAATVLGCTWRWATRCSHTDRGCSAVSQCNASLPNPHSPAKPGAPILSAGRGSSACPFAKPATPVLGTACSAEAHPTPYTQPHATHEHCRPRHAHTVPCQYGQRRCSGCFTGSCETGGHTGRDAPSSSGDGWCDTRASV